MKRVRFYTVAILLNVTIGAFAAQTLAQNAKQSKADQAATEQSAAEKNAAEKNATEKNAKVWKKFSESILSARNPASDLVVSGSVQPRKRYPGGADEDDLQVQPVLANPSRGLEAHDAAVSEAATNSSGETSASD
ncbi:MAG: hypothetical protein U1E10_12050 [Bdellovibrionales bacterium]|nr:hypothetical protein [Bdellovibrionales bacterium]